MINPEMITRAREFRGKTQTEMGTYIPSLSQALLSRIERNKAEITEVQIEEISKYLNLPKEFFYQNDFIKLNSELNFRKRANIKSIEQKQLEARIRVILQSIDKLFLEIELPEFSLPEIDYNYYNEDDYPSIAAEITRKHFRLGNGPIKDIIKTLEVHGIIVLSIGETINEFDAVSAITDKGRPVIIFNSEKPNDRIRFNLAHELGHLVMHQQEYVEPSRNKEKEADNFAGSFLFPMNTVKGKLNGLTLKEAYRLKLIWNISMSSVIANAFRYGEINNRERTNLMINLSRNGWRRKEPGIVEIDRPELMDNIIEFFKNELEYTEEQIANLMLLNIEDFQVNFTNHKPRIIKIHRKN